MAMQILIATQNRGKARELASLFSVPDIEFVDLAAAGIEMDVAETGATFAENADLKASAYGRRSGLLTLADDSGLVVDALGGAPGVLSARYAGDGASDSQRIAKLLDELAGTDASRRAARFICAMSIATGDGEIVFRSEGVCSGRIIDAPRGELGFGYDPVFLPQGYDKTFGELPSSVKDAVSHRALAARSALRFLQGFVATLT